MGQIAVTPRPGFPLNRTQRHLLSDLPDNPRWHWQPAAHRGLPISWRGVGASRGFRASRQRLVTAQDDERRRLERDLHDGAQQQLVAVAVRLRLAAAGCVADPAGTAASLDEIRSQVSQALAGLRDLARGVFPSLLADAGIGAALGAHIARTAAPARLDDQLPTGRRFDREVEAAVYFGCLEALQDHRARGGRPTCRCSAAACRRRADLRSTRRRPGIRSGRARSGSGLAGIADRLAAVGGTLTVDSAPGKGTAVHGTVPV